MNSQNIAFGAFGIRHLKYIVKYSQNDLHLVVIIAISLQHVYATLGPFLLMEPWSYV